jgi:hypothetical protein
MSRLVNAYPHTDKNGRKDILLYANTTNGPAYSKSFCV